MADIGFCFIPFCCGEVSMLGQQSDANKFTLNKTVISLLILSPNFLAAAKIVLHDYISVTSTIPHPANMFWSVFLWTLKVMQQCPLCCVSTMVLACTKVFNLINLTLCTASRVPCRLKKKSQSVDIASQGFSPTLVPASPLNKAAPPVAKTTTVLAVQENNTTNSQRRSPRCGELKRGYTIGKGHQCPLCLLVWGC